MSKFGNIESVRPAVLPEYRKFKPNSLWIKITNITDEGKFLVELEIDGEKEIIFNSYPSQEDGIVLQSTNLSWVLDKRLKDKPRMPDLQEN